MRIDLSENIIIKQGYKPSFILIFVFQFGKKLVPLPTVLAEASIHIQIDKNWIEDSYYE